MCKRCIVLMPKFRRKVIYNQGRRDIGEILRKPCEYMGAKMVGGSRCPTTCTCRWPYHPGFFDTACGRVQNDMLTIAGLDGRQSRHIRLPLDRHGCGNRQKYAL